MKNVIKLLAPILLTGLVLPASIFAREMSWANRTDRNMIREAHNVPVEFTEENLVWELDTNTSNQYPMPVILQEYGVALTAGEIGIEDPAWEPHVHRGGEVVCRRLSDGSVIWRAAVPDMSRPGGFGVCGTPVVKDERVYYLSAFHVMCLDLRGMTNGNQGIQEKEEWELLTRDRSWSDRDTFDPPKELPEWAADVIWYYSFKDGELSVQDATCATPLVFDGQVWIATANEMGYEARGAVEKNKKRETYGQPIPFDDHPRLLVLDVETGKLIAEDNMQVPVVWHGEWSSPTLLEVNGEKCVLFGDGYGLLHGLAVPTPSPDGEPVTLEEYWVWDMNPPEWRGDEQGRRHPYKLDERLEFKYPPSWHQDETKWIQLEERDPLIDGPSELIAMPVVVGNRVYVGIGRDWNYAGGVFPKHRDVSPAGGRGFRRFGGGRFMCLEFDDVKNPPRVRWEDRDVGRTQSNASVKDGLVYVSDFAGFLNCWDADTGEVVYKYDIRASVKERSQLVTDGKIYVSNDRNELLVIKAGREPELLGEHRFRHHIATVEVADNLLLAVTAGEAFLYRANPQLASGEER